MTNTSLAIWVASVTLLLGACAPAASQPAAPTASQAPPSTSTNSSAGTPEQAQRLSGKVTARSVDRVTLDDGRTFGVTNSTSVIVTHPGTTADLRTGEYVAVTAKRQPDETLLATIVNVFPTAPSQFGQFQRPMGEGNLMTNAVVEKIENVDGQRFTVTFPNGRDQVTLALDAQIRVLASGSPVDIKTGAILFAQVVGDVAQTVLIQ